MKFLIAAIKPFTLEKTCEVLAKLGVEDIVVVDIAGHGRQSGHTEIYRGAEYLVTFVPKVRLEFAVADDALEAALAVIGASARTGSIGDGKIFVLDLGTGGPAT